MEGITKNKTIGEALRFGIVGIVATATHWGIYYLLLPVIPVNLAYIAGYAISFLLNFYLTTYFTFRTSPSWKRFAGMVGAHGVNFAVHLILLNLMLFMGISPQIAPIPVFCIAVPLNFLLVRYVFQTPRRSCSK